MAATKSTPIPLPLSLRARTAADMMTPNPISIRAVTTVRDGIRFLADKGFSAAPVIDEAGRPVGVFSRADVLVHAREDASRGTAAEFYQRAELAAAPGDAGADGTPRPDIDTARVRDVMTPAVFAVPPDAPARRVVEDMVGLRVHRLFVISPEGVLVGVISALDVLKHLTPPAGT